MSHTNRPAWAEVDLGNFRRNLQTVGAQIPEGAGILVVLKANAYGLGAKETARVALTADKVTGFGVATSDEALELRKQEIDSMVLVLGPSTEAATRLLIRNDISVTVTSKDTLVYADAGANSLGRKARVHLKIDTGMGRIGVNPHEELDAVLNQLKNMQNIQLEGIYTHLSSVDSDRDYTKRQLELFDKSLEKARNLGLYPKYCHAANSAAVFACPKSHYNLVRPGIYLYGSLPKIISPKTPRPLPVLSIRTRVSHVKKTPAGTPIGYDRTFYTEKDTVIATIPIGYADGYPRLLSNRGSVLVRGKRMPIVGSVCMDQIMFDAHPLQDLKVGESVTLIGEDKDAKIGVDEVARLAKTIPNEVLTGLAARLPRIYI